MVKNQLREVEKNLRWIAKRNKNISFSIGLVLLYVMLGMNAFTEEVNTIVATKQEIGLSTDRLSEMLRRIKEENSKKLKGTQLELVQLMEQGDQVVKSPWSSWQFGINYFSNNGTGRYRGRGDKDKKYIFNGIYTRENWKVKNAMNIAASNGPTGSPITLGNENISSWQNANSDSSGGVTIEKDSSISSGTNGNRSWGLVDLRDLKEPINEIEILAHISPKEVTKQAISLNITEPRVQTLEAPVVNPQVNEPLDPPEILLPNVESVDISPLTINAPDAPNAPVISIAITAPNAPVPPVISVEPTSPSSPSAPTIDISVVPPSITPLTITTPDSVEAPNVVSLTVKPVDFTVAPGGDSLQYTSDKDDSYGTAHQGWKASWPKTINVTELANRNYVSLTRDTVDSTIPADQVINVTAENNRAMVVDEVQKEGIKVDFKGTINLQRSQNVGIDLQGTHQGSASAPLIANIYNSGKIIGAAKSGSSANKEQIAFGFNNADGSNNTTMTNMVNKGEITLNAPSSAGIQLKPEDPHNWQPKSWDAAPLQINSRTTSRDKGRVLMKADNQKDINLNASGSFGIVTVFNEGVPKRLFVDGYSDYENLKSERIYDGVRVLPGGEIGRSALADSKYTSGVYNTGNININGDNSIGVGLLQEIQEVKIDGNINIGTKVVNQETGISNLQNSASKIYSTNKVEEAVGVFAGVPTMPVRVGEKDTLIDNSGTGNTANSLVGTETVEINGNISLGEHATQSIGALVGDTEVDLNKGQLTENGVNKGSNVDRKLKRSGDITAKSNSVINVGGKKNYGFVVSNSAHSSKFGTTVDDLIYTTDKANHGKGVNEGIINVTGEDSVGFAMIKGGDSKSSGTISVKDNAENSIGFYGKEDNFTNSGTIEVTSAKKKNKAVVLDGTNASNKMNFTNTGNIYVNTPENSNTNLDGTGNIGIYAQGNYKLEHNSGKVIAGSNAIAFYVKNTTGEVNIKAPIELANSKSGGTTIGVYSDGDAKVKFGINSNLKIGEGAVGLYSSDPTKFNSTFEIETGKTLNVELGKNSTFGLLNGNKNVTNSLLLSKYLNNNSNDKINVTAFGEGASLFYATLKAKAILDGDYKITNGNAASTAVLIANDGSSVEIANGKTLETNTNVGLIATRGAGVSGFISVVENKGTLISTRDDKGIGIYTSYATGKNSGTITMNNKNAVGILGSVGSNLTNTSKIELKGISSAGIYAENSNMENLGNTSEIIVNKETSVGMYAKLTSVSSVDKKAKNEGNINIKADGNGKSAGMYSKVEGSSVKLTTENTGKIEVAQKASAGIYAKNESSQINTQSIATNSGLIKMNEENSIGVTGEKSKIENSGTGNNGIEITGKKSAGILVTKESEVINTGRILLENNSVSNSSDGLVGISVDNSSIAKNDANGEIKVNTNYSTGMLSSGGDIKNVGTINLEKKESVGMYTTNANVTNSGAASKGILIKDEKSIGIYAKLNSGSTADKKILNSGLIDIGGTSKAGSAGIYSLFRKWNKKIIYRKFRNNYHEPKLSSGYLCKE